MKIELTDYGLDDTLKMIQKDLDSALGHNSRRRKDEMIYKALGAINTLWHTIRVSEEAKEDILKE